MGFKKLKGIKTFLATLKIAWYIILGKAGSYVFIRLTKKQQLALLNDEDTDINIFYIGVDKRCISKICLTQGKE